MARRRPTQTITVARVASGGLTRAATSPWPHLEELLEKGGHITIGHLAPIRCAAIAADDRNMLAALIPRNGETLAELMHRLDTAIDNALNHDAFIDEINAR